MSIKQTVIFQRGELVVKHVEPEIHAEFFEIRVGDTLPLRFPPTLFNEMIDACMKYTAIQGFRTMTELMNTNPTEGGNPQDQQ